MKTKTLYHPDDPSQPVTVNADHEQAYLQSGWSEKAPDVPKGYADQRVDDLKAEIDSRNEGRDEADLIPATGVKADLVAALEADDNK